MSTKIEVTSILKGRYYQEYSETVKAKKSLELYNLYLKLFLNDVGMDLDSFVDLAKSKPSEAQDIIKRYLLKHKVRVLEGKLSAHTLRNYVKPIKHLCIMSDVNQVNFAKLSRLMPTARKIGQDRVPTISELRKVDAILDQRDKFLLSLLMSSGIRIGAIPDMNIGDIEPKRNSEGEIIAGKVTIYKGYPEEYFSFITPECWGRLEDYMKSRREAGEDIKPESPLIRYYFAKVGYANLKDRTPKRLQSDPLAHIIHRGFVKAGLRQRRGKHEVKRVHGLRKFFKTNSDTVMKPAHVELLLGHSIGISDHYYKPNEQTLLEDYLKAIPLLTISEAEEVRHGLEAEMKEERETIRELQTELKVVKETLMNLVAKENLQ